jgi:hypothetical protein
MVFWRGEGGGVSTSHLEDRAVKEREHQQAFSSPQESLQIPSNPSMARGGCPLGQKVERRSKLTIHHHFELFILLSKLPFDDPTGVLSSFTVATVPMDMAGCISETW